MFDLLADPYEQSDLISRGLTASESTTRSELIAWLEGLGVS